MRNGANESGAVIELIKSRSDRRYQKAVSGCVDGAEEEGTQLNDNMYSRGNSITCVVLCVEHHMCLLITGCVDDLSESFL